MPPSALTVRHIVAEYAERGASRWSTNTQATYGLIIKKQILPHLGTTKIVELTPRTVQLWIDRLGKEKLSASLIENAKIVLSGACRDAVQMGIIPLYMIMVKLGWQNHLQAVIVPFLVTGFGVFMMRQYADQAVPDELIEAARVDGCTTFGIYWRVVLPALRPAAGVLGLFTFMQSWNDFMWPLAVLTPENPTVQLSINNLANAHFNDYTLMFAGTTVAVLPLLVVFIIFGRQIIGGIMEGAVKA